MKLTLSGRLDLIRALAHDDPLLRAQAVALLGFHEAPAPPLERPPEMTRPPVETQQAHEPQPVVPYEPADVPFWCLQAYEAVAVETGDMQRVATASSGLLWQLCPDTVPGAAPLAPERVMLTRLRRMSVMRRASHDIDVDAVVDRLSRGLWLSDLPHRERRQWGSSLYVMVDRSRRLVPYWQDQDAIVRVLQDLYPSYGLTITYLGDGERQPVIRWPEDRRGQVAPPLPGVTVLVLSDLGCLANSGDHLRRFWLDLGHRLSQSSNPAIAMVPAQFRELSPELTRLWTVVSWTPTSEPTLLDAASEPASVSDVLTLLSPAVRVEPGLLRAIRGLLPGGRDDPGLEARVWQDDAFASQHSVAASWKPERREAYLARFARLRNEALRQAALDVIRSRRGHLHPAIWFEEILALDAHSKATLVDARDLADAEAFLGACVEEVRRSGQVTVSRAAWLCRLTERFPEAACEDPKILAAMNELYNLVRPHDVDTAVPRWFDPPPMSSSHQRVSSVELWQVGNQLVFKTVDETTASDPLVRYGSLLGVVQTASGEIKVLARHQAPFWQSGSPPAWADRWGHDAYGPWATLRIGGVEQRLRWMAPGRFWMGSPEDKEGRYDDEGTRHEVELSQGFWLFDTPCTQALWEAVMGENPSRFQGANRPVESVSWDDCQSFISKLNEQFPGLELRLPTEAQWEYACRAGTQGSRYNADLDAIAWYAGNSGVETHEVGQKRPNAWGLYDMLGNVDEWCHDGRRDYESGLAIDPVGQTEAGAVRVIRGGFWGVPARHARAAVRSWGDPGLRREVIGFRCSSSGSEPVRAREGWRESEQKAELAETTPPLPAARLLNVQRQPELATVFPDADWLEVSTDHERLRFGRIIRPSWAKAIGRDSYGLWARFEVQGVRLRLRWIGPGRFWMGSPEDEAERYDREGPRHEVELSQGFWLFDTPCTQALWEAVMEENPSDFQGANRPVENVSWEDCQSFIIKLNEAVPGLELSLPTEAQWEYACRAGTQGSRYDSDINAIAWYGENSGGETHEVGQKRPNAWGLYDMLGNVDEWCHDDMRDYGSGLVIDPVGPTEAGALRVIRGGVWGNDARFVRAAYRSASGPGSRNQNIGFRCLSSGVSAVDGMRRARRRAEGGAREDRDRSDAVGRRGRRKR